MKRAFGLFVAAAFGCALARPSAEAVWTLGIVSVLYAFQETLSYFDAKNTQPSKSLETLTAEMEKLVRDVADSKNKISSLSMAASMKSIPTKNPFTR